MGAGDAGLSPPLELLPPKSLHVSSAHAPRPVRRVVDGAGPPRLVTYDGQEFEVVFDGVDTRLVEEVRQ